MPSIRKCAKCGLDLSGTSAAVCPMCSAPIAASIGSKVWIGGLIQFALSTGFMLAFGFPKVMIGIFGAVILVGTAISSRAKVRKISSRPVPQRPVSHPVGLRIVSVAILLCGFAFVCFLLFGFVIFMNAQTRWHQYDGQRYERADFVVTRVFYQKLSRGGRDVYASGTVNEHKEWMNLAPYLQEDGQTVPRTEGEVDERVPTGTSIPIYFFPDLKGRARVRVYNDTPPAQAYHRTAMEALKGGLLGVGICGGLMFILIRLRSLCFENSTVAAAPNDLPVGQIG